MKNNPYNELAMMFKENENKHYLGPLLAEVVSPLPNLKLKLLNGAIELDKEIEGDNIFLARSITNRIDIDITFKDFESQKNIHTIKSGIKLAFKKLFASGGQVSHPGPPPQINPPGANGPVPPGISLMDIPTGTFDELTSELAKKQKGKYKMQTIVTLKVGEKVLVIPNETEDQWFIVDVFDPLKEVKLDWEYYQKS